MVEYSAALVSSCGELEEYKTEMGRIYTAGDNEAARQRRSSRQEWELALGNSGMARQAAAEVVQQKRQPPGVALRRVCACAAAWRSAS